MNIETERLIIKPLTLDDARRFSEYRDKEEVAMYQSWDEYPLNKAINRIEYCQKHPFHGQIGNYQFGLYLKENNQLIGDIFIEIDGHTTFTLGYTLDSVYWSKGYASEALKSVFKAMHETYSFKICLCHVYEDNIKFRDLAHTLKIPLTYKEGPGEHEWGFWDNAIREVIDWLPIE